LEARLAYYKIPGISIAVINNGVVDWARGFGYMNESTKEPVVQSTLFQAASISKVLTAIAFMKLKEKNEIDLDTDVNAYLRSWKIPMNNGWQPKVTTFPGTHARYSGGGFIVAQLILEDKFKQPFYSIMEQTALLVGGNRD